MATDKAAVQVAIPVKSEVHSAQVVPPVTGPYPLAQRVQAVAEQVIQLSPQSVQTLLAKY